jgi:hypothetical protein
LGDIAHAIGYLAKLVTFTVLATAHTDGIVNDITEEHMTLLSLRYTYSLSIKTLTKARMQGTRFISV